MKPFFILLCCVVFILSCKKEAVSKPNGLIEEEKMIAVFYDLALLEGIKSQNISAFQSLKSNDFIYKKYKIDSLQFAESTKFYSSDITNYKKMLVEVVKKIESQKQHVDSIIKKNPQKEVLTKRAKKEVQFVK